MISGVHPGQTRFGEQRSTLESAMCSPHVAPTYTRVRISIPRSRKWNLCPVAGSKRLATLSLTTCEVQGSISSWLCCLLSRYPYAELFATRPDCREILNCVPAPLPSPTETRLLPGDDGGWLGILDWPGASCGSFDRGRIMLASIAASRSLLRW